MLAVPKEGAIPKNAGICGGCPGGPAGAFANPVLVDTLMLCGAFLGELPAVDGGPLGFVVLGRH